MWAFGNRAGTEEREGALHARTEYSYIPTTHRMRIEREGGPPEQLPGWKQGIQKHARKCVNIEQTMRMPIGERGRGEASSAKEPR